MDQIPNETLVYLNKNLDLVTEYAQTHDDLYATQLPPHVFLNCVTRPCNRGPLNGNIYVMLWTGFASICGVYKWRDLLEYVENNQRLVLK